MVPSRRGGADTSYIGCSNAAANQKSEMIQFIINNEVKQGFILAQDSDPSCAIWVVDASNPDVDFFIFRNQIV